jgi:proline dehydrogenase
MAQEVLNQISFDNTEIAFEHLSNADLNFSIRMYQLMNNAGLVKVGTSLARKAVKWGLPITWAVRQTVFRQFCGGVTIDESMKRIQHLQDYGIGAILDFAVEGAQDENIFDQTKDEIINVLRRGKNVQGIPFGSMKMTGIARFDLLAKVNAKEELNEAEKAEYKRIVGRFDEICKAAFEFDVPIFVDAEETWIQDAVDRLIESKMRQYNKEKSVVCHTIQMYRWDKLKRVEELINESKREGFILGVKFVRGAYLEKENVRAERMGYKTLMQPNKAATDHDYDAAIELMTEHIEHTEICNGTHNELSSMKLVELMQNKGLEPGDRRIWFSQLYGMSDNISFNLAKHGYNVAKYLPYGPVKATIPYLTRRAEENTAIAGQMGRELSLLLREKKRRQKNG